VLVVPIANLKNRNAVNPLQPKTSRLVLVEIENYLKTLTSPFVHVHAKNPVYEEIIVAFKVKFYSGYDIGFYLKKLNEEIVHYLTPWAFDENAEVIFGAEVYASSIINFIEEREYVDFITDFFMAVCREQCCPGEHAHTKAPITVNADGVPSVPADTLAELDKACSCEELLYLLVGNDKFKGEIIAKPSGPRSILVSVPQHIIIPYEEPGYLSPCERRLKKGQGAVFPAPIEPVDDTTTTPPPPPPPPPPPAPPAHPAITGGSGVITPLIAETKTTGTPKTKGPGKKNVP
jgi:hypothetical protein